MENIKELIETGEMDTALEQEDILASLDTFLSLGDDEFEIMSQLLLEEMALAFQSKEFRQQVLNDITQGTSTPEEMEEMFRAAQDEIQKTDYSQKKKDFVTAYMGLLYTAYLDVLEFGLNAVVIPIEVCRDRKGIPLPGYMKEGDAGMDVYALDDYEIRPGQTVVIPTGIKMAVPSGYEVQVRDKSGRTISTKLRVANSPGTVDSGYRDEVGVIVENIEPIITDIEVDYNDRGEPIIKSLVFGRSFIIERGMRFAQLVLTPVATAGLREIKSIGEIPGDREGGFGSTGLS